MILSLQETLSRLPGIPEDDLRPWIREFVAARTGHKLVVLDDDPTGTQTVYDVAVLTCWDVKTLLEEFERPTPCFYVLTNSRSLPSIETAHLHRELARNLRSASSLASTPDARSFTLASRSDSTLRGHFPLETDILSNELGPFDATLMAPYFQAGGRYTIDDVHYLAEGDRLTPASDTAFARDAFFGYTHSNLREWIEEKTCGRIRAGEVQSISLAELRGSTKASAHEAARQVSQRLRALKNGAVGIVNACDLRDIEVFAAATLLAERGGGRYLFRTAAEFVAARLGLAPRPLIERMTLSKDSTEGGLLVIGSYVSRTTEQLERLFHSAPVEAIELPVAAALDAACRGATVANTIVRIEACLKTGRDAVLFTTREFMGGDNAVESLERGRRISRALVEIVGGLRVRPRFLVAKGGITSSDIATEALRVRRAWVRGQVLPGVPVWRLGEESRFPGMDFVVFPGNVGGPDELLALYRKCQS